MTYNQVQSFQVNDYANHNVDIEITGYRELYSINCMCIIMCVCVCVCACVHVCVCCLYTKSSVMLAITQLSHFSDLAIITAQTFCKQSHRRSTFNTFSRYVMCYTVNT